MSPARFMLTSILISFIVMPGLAAVRSVRWLVRRLDPTSRRTFALTLARPTSPSRRSTRRFHQKAQFARASSGPRSGGTPRRRDVGRGEFQDDDAGDWRGRLRARGREKQQIASGGGTERP